jgi:hypothetical protein
MKSVLVFLLATSLVLSAKAASLNVSTGQKVFKTYNSILASDVESAEQMLREYMEDTMGCSKVRMSLRVIKEDGIFSSGLFDLSLNADCASSIENVRIDFSPLCLRKNSGEAALRLQYTQEGQIVNKLFVVDNSESCQE